MKITLFKHKSKYNNQKEIDYISLAKEYLAEAARQYKHNDNSPGFIPGYDYELTAKLVANLLKKLDN